MTRLLSFGYGNSWYARGDFNIIRPDRSVIQIKRFEPREVFRSKEEAEAYGLKLAKAWVDKQRCNDCPTG